VRWVAHGYFAQEMKGRHARCHLRSWIGRRSLRGITVVMRLSAIGGFLIIGKDLFQFPAMISLVALFDKPIAQQDHYVSKFRCYTATITRRGGTVMRDDFVQIIIEFEALHVENLPDSTVRGYEQ
jgi:hypothetical protein